MLTELLDANLAALRRLDTADDYDDKRTAADEFVDGHLPLGLAIAAAPELRYDRATTDYLYATAPLVERNLSFIESHADETRRTLGLPFDGEDEWGRVCARRSAFEFVRELYAESSAAERLAAIDLGELDDRLRFVGAREGQAAAELPADLPTSHWWWWLPGDPPDA